MPSKCDLRCVKLVLCDNEQVALIKVYIGIDVPYNQDPNGLINVILLRWGLWTKRKWVRYNWTGPIRVAKRARLAKACYGRSVR